MSPDHKIASTLWLLRVAAIGVSTYLLFDLMRQYFAGSITMGYGEFNDEIVVTSPLGRFLALSMWGTFLGGVFLAGVRPQLFRSFRWLAPALLAATFTLYVLFSLVGDFSLK